MFIVVGPLATSILPKLKNILLLTLGTEKMLVADWDSRLRSRAVRRIHDSLVDMTIQRRGADIPES